MFASKNVFLAAPSGYTIGRSVRTRSSASAYFNRTPSSASSRTTWTLSLWLKRGNLTASTYWFSAGAGGSDNDFLSFTFDTSARFNCGLWNYAPLTSTQVFRDPSAWYHFVIAVDTNQATASNRMRVYVNGSEITAWTTDSRASISQGQTLSVNNTVAHNIGRSAYGANFYFDGYMTEINFINAQQLTPSSFGQTNTLTGAWDPKKYSGSYGNNGFYLNFSDNSAATATTIGKDYSGNGNNWTPNNISVTAGVTYDSMIDSPTVGPTASNYAVLNPVNYTGANYTLDGNLKAQLVVSSGAYGVLGNMPVTSGTKRYFEVNITSVNTWAAVGIIDIAYGVYQVGYAFSAGSNCVLYYKVSGQKGVNGTFSAYSGNSFANGDIVGVAVDYVNNTCTFYLNNVSQGAINLPSTAVNYAPVFLDVNNQNGAVDFNFGQRPFTYTPPTGFSSINTQNIPTPTIPNGSAYMAATLYTGTGSSLAVTNTVNGVSFQPDFVWAKDRTNTGYHGLFDAVRGVGTTKGLSSNSTEAQGTYGAYLNLTSFNSNGFTVGTTSSTNFINTSGASLVGWQWKAGGSSVTNTSGSITSTVNAGATQGFSIVTYTGNGTAGATIGHGLGVVPNMIIVKSSSAVVPWVVYTSALGNTGSLYLNLTNSFTTVATWNNTTPTSSVFSVNGTGYYPNDSGATYVAYCFAAVAGYSAFGTYVGNGLADGTFVYTGFRPRWVLIKAAIGTTGDWNLQDTSRNPYNSLGNGLFPNGTYAENSGYLVDILSNGFKLRFTGAYMNGSGVTMFYAAFAENPFKYSRAR